MSGFRIEGFSADDMAGMADDWTSLLRRSRADPLFMGWEWLASWWETFGPSSTAQWAGIKAVDPGGRTAAICPIFQRKSRLRGILPLTRLEPLGNFWYGPPSVLTQYGQFLGEFSSRPGLMGSLLDHLAERLDWSELAFPMLPGVSETFRCVADEARARGWRVRATPTLPSQVVRLDEGFDEYLRTLSHKTRRRLYNQRKRLNDLGRVEFRHARIEEADEFIRLMSTLRNRPEIRGSFSNRAIEFHRAFFRRLEPRGELRLSCLSVNGSPVSVNYALRIGEREYGVQVGYDATMERRLSLGMLHLGYALEAAANDGIKSYDLMTGVKEIPDWKAAVSNTQIEMVALQIVRSPSLYRLYQLYDLPSRNWR